MSEPELPGILPPSKPPWYRRLSARRKWPGWASIALGGTRIFHIGEDIDFALGVLRSLGGELGVIATVIASPVFAMGLIAYGVLHLIVVGEPKNALRHHAWTYVGWAIFGASLAAIIIVLGLGYFEFRLREAISSTPLSVVTDRRLDDSTQQCLKTALPEQEELKGRKITVGAINGDREGMRYANDFLNVFDGIDLADDALNHKGGQGTRFAHPLNSNDPAMHGVLIGASDKDQPTADATALRRALARCGIAARFVSMDLQPNQTWLIIDQPP
jgi:hypothetical protein